MNLICMHSPFYIEILYKFLRNILFPSVVGFSVNSCCEGVWIRDCSQSSSCGLMLFVWIPTPCFSEQGQNTDEPWLEPQTPPHWLPRNNVCFPLVKATPAMGVLVPGSICLLDLTLVFLLGHYTVASFALYPPPVPPSLLCIVPQLSLLSPC